MKQNVKSIIVLILTIVIFTFISLLLNFVRNINAKVVKNENKIGINIKNEIIDSLNILTAEAEYEEIITRRETWIMGLNPSIARVKVKGNIKVGSRLIDVKKAEDKYIISLSEPEVLQHEIVKQGQWETKEGILNGFDPIIEGEIFENSKKSMEDRLYDELKQESIKNNELAIYSILGRYTKEKISEENCEIMYLQE